MSVCPSLLFTPPHAYSILIRCTKGTDRSLLIVTSPRVVWGYNRATIPITTHLATYCIYWQRTYRGHTRDSQAASHWRMKELRNGVLSFSGVPTCATGISPYSCYLLSTAGRGDGWCGGWVHDQQPQRLPYKKKRQWLAEQASQQ